LNEGIKDLRNRITAVCWTKYIILKKKTVPKPEQYKIHEWMIWLSEISDLHPSLGVKMRVL
jgi:hypothetical protein